MSIRQRIKNNEHLYRLYCWAINYIAGRNTYRVRNNSLFIKEARLYKTEVVIRGKNNSVQIGKGSTLRNCKIFIYGNNSKVVIGENVIANGARIHIEDEKSTIEILHHTTIENDTEIAAIEGTRIRIGRDCMISSVVRICTGDSHSLIDLDGNRINHSVDITVGDHCWIGTRVVVNKGVVIPEHCTIGSCSVLTQHLRAEPYSVIAGIPGKTIRKQVDWKRERL